MHSLPNPQQQISATTVSHVHGPNKFPHSCKFIRHTVGTEWLFQPPYANQALVLVTIFHSALVGTVSYLETGVPLETLLDGTNRHGGVLFYSIRQIRS